MELQTLKYFNEVAKTGNLTRAAFNLKVTQPTITKQIKELEKELGHKLYTRVSKGVELTTAGKILKDKVSDMLLIEESTISELETLSPNIPKKLTIACADNTIRKDMSAVLNSFMDEYPEVKLCLKSGDMDYIKYDTRHDISDISIGYYDTDEKNLIITNLHLKLGLLMRKSDDLNSLDNIDSQLLQTLPLAAPKKNTVSFLLDKIGIPYDRLNVVVEFDDTFNYFSLIHRPGIYALCLEPSNNVLYYDLFCFKPLKPEIEGTVGIKYSRHRNNPYTMVFLRHLMQAGIINYIE